MTGQKQKHTRLYSGSVQFVVPPPISVVAFCAEYDNWKQFTSGVVLLPLMVSGGGAPLRNTANERS